MSTPTLVAPAYSDAVTTITEEVTITPPAYADVIATVEVTQVTPTEKKKFPWWIIPLLLGLGYIAFSGYKEEEEY
ncbi:MAG: hypothetical protein DRO40_12215 [Thermoprotei archaeon]|nr:MAG: hypothetical protein DRO40_12215 [Thermoprotei archaeon]